MNNMLLDGQRYLFYETTPWGELRQYRANYMGLFGEGDNRQIITNCVDTEYSKSTIMCTPYYWITKIQSLEDIADNTIIPRDALFIIDNYL